MLPPHGAAALQGVVLLPPRGAAFCGSPLAWLFRGGPCKAQGRALGRALQLALAALAALVKSSSAASSFLRTTPREGPLATPLGYEWCAHCANSRAKTAANLAGGGASDARTSVATRRSASRAFTSGCRYKRGRDARAAPAREREGQ